MFFNVSAVTRDQGQTLKGDTHAHIHIHPPMPSTHHMPITHVHVYPVHLHTRRTCTHSCTAHQRITMQNLTELHQRCQQGVAWSPFRSRRKTFSRTNAVAASRVCVNCWGGTAPPRAACYLGVNPGPWPSVHSLPSLPALGSTVEPRGALWNPESPVGPHRETGTGC